MAPHTQDKPECLDAFSGEGGAGWGWHLAGFNVVGVDNAPARLRRYPFQSFCGDALNAILRDGVIFDFIHASPPCTGYTRGTVAVPDRLARYDRLIAATREALMSTGRPWVIENVADARAELRNPLTLCGSMFGLTAADDDGTPLRLERHRLFEFSPDLPMIVAPGPCRHDKTVQVAGSYSGARRDKWEAKHIRKGGYVPSADVQRALVGVPWMSERGCQLSIPPVYTEWIGAQVMEHLRAGVAA